MRWLDSAARAALKSCFLWGGLLTLASYGALQAVGQWLNPYAVRCLAGRWESYVCVTMFWVGFAALTVKAVDLARQAVLRRRLSLTSPPRGMANMSAAESLLEQLQAQPRVQHTSYLHRRLCDALRFILRTAGHEPYSEQLRTLADLDLARMYASYGLPRYITWAIPTIGSLGTVLGIAATVTQLSLQAPATPIQPVTDGLAIAFDTMALALALSIVLTFVKFICEQQETALLTAVERQVSDELSEKLGRLAAPATSQVDQLRKLTESVVEATQKLTESRAAAGGSNPTAAMGEQLESIVSRAVAKAVAGQPLGPSSIPTIDSGGVANLEQVQQALQQIANFFARQQAAQLRESEVILQLAEFIHGEAANGTARKPAHSTAPKTGNGLAGLMHTLSE